MSDLMEAIDFARDRLLLAARALDANDEATACDELNLAADRLQAAIEELRDEAVA